MVKRGICQKYPSARIKIPGAVGLAWSRDPVMVLPKFVTDGSTFGLNTGVIFVANSKTAFNGSILLSHQEELGSKIGFSGGLVYREGEYHGGKLPSLSKRVLQLGHPSSWVRATERRSEL